MNNPRLSLALQKLRQAAQLNQEACEILTAEILAQENPELPVSTKEERCPKCDGKFDSFLGLCNCPVSL